MSKAELKREKDYQLQQIQQEIRKYDLEEMKTDVSYKAAIVINNLKKTERALIADENRNLRQLDKGDHLHKALAEDFTALKDSLDSTQRLQTRAQENFSTVEKENQEELRKYEQQMAQLEETLAKLQRELESSKGDNHKLRSELDAGRREDKENLMRQAAASSNPENS